MPTLKAFWETHPDSEKSLKAWYKLMRSGEYGSLGDLKEHFVVDYVPPRYYVFDIGGNKYRLVALINFAGKRVLIESVMTHKDYDHWSKTQQKGG